MKKIFYTMLVLLSAVPLFADGFIVLPERHPVLRTAYPLEVKYHNVKVSVDGLSAETTVEQEFFNPTGYRLEGVYMFPVPKGSAIKKFGMFIDGKEAEAEILDAAKARSIYEDIVRKQMDPAILEYSDRSVFKLRIFPIEPHGRKRVKITYSEILTQENGSIEYVYPLNTEKFSSKNLDQVRVYLSVKQGQAIQDLFCPTHPLSVNRDSANAFSALYEARDIKPDSDFKVYINTDSRKVGTVFRAHRTAGDDGFFFINASPGFAEHEVSEKDIIFILDVSGSMAGDKLAQAKNALSYCVKNLNRGDRFQIIRFSTEAEPLFDRLMPADEVSRGKAFRFIDGLKAIGGTDLEDAVKLAMDLKRDPSRPCAAVLITDGKPTVGETNEDILINQLKKYSSSNMRFFTFGLGFDLNTHLLDRITESTRGYRTYLAPHDDLEKAVSSFYAKIQSPVLTDITATFKGIKTMKCSPKDIPDLFAGSSVSLFGRYDGSGEASLILEGKLKGKAQKFIYPLQFPAEYTGNDFIPSIWATRRVGYLLDQIRLHGENRELTEEIVSLARAYGIVTPYTSYLIIEDENRRVGRGDLSPDDATIGNVVPVSPPAALEYRREMNDMRSKSGEGSVKSSSELQAMNEAGNAAQTKQVQKRFFAAVSPDKDTKGSEQMRQVQGRTFYNTKKGWVDPKIQSRKNLSVRKIRFASDEYFALIQTDPDITQFLSAGRNVRFVYRNMVYDIGE